MNIVMLMLRSIAPAINLKKQQEKNTLQFFFILCTWPISPLGIYGTVLLMLMQLMTTAKKNSKHYSRDSHPFAWNWRLYWSADCLPACAKCDLARSRFKFAGRNGRRKFLIHKGNITKNWSGDPTFLMQKNYSTAKVECMCKIIYILKKKLWGGISPTWKFPFC